MSRKARDEHISSAIHPKSGSSSDALACPRSARDPTSGDTINSVHDAVATIGRVMVSSAKDIWPLAPTCDAMKMVAVNREGAERLHSRHQLQSVDIGVARQTPITRAVQTFSCTLAMPVLGVFGQPFSDCGRSSLRQSRLAAHYHQISPFQKSDQLATRSSAQ